ncbi:HTH-like domain-containing protein [Litoreibacter roseus]|uniref:HTH-like domain-containing protein n=1 Tax=Litoreibacter roseus TaxID=2601869 RepID=A0A6N6JCU8_9RHOB|nr:hypothetical protein KIN_03230 [Litoreibacter roseus]
MTEQEFGQILKANYNSASAGMVATTIHLFGIRYANSLSELSIRDICKIAGIPVSYVTEINKGIRLANHVSLKEGG